MPQRRYYRPIVDPDRPSLAPIEETQAERHRRELQQKSGAKAGRKRHQHEP